MLAAALVLFLAGPARAASDPVLSALNAELRRSFKSLRGAEETPLYYLSYQAEESHVRRAGAVLGSLLEESLNASRVLDVDARVGSRRLDNTHQLKGAESAHHGDHSAAGELPLDDDPLALRQAAWELTDHAFKEAQNRYIKVATDKAVTAGEADDSDDFSSEPPHQAYEPPPAAPPDPGPWRERLRRLSAVAARYPFLIASNAELTLESHRTWFVDSDGAALSDESRTARLDFELTARTTDGMELDRGRWYEVSDVSELPDEAAMTADFERSAAELAALLKAPDAVPYHGPAVFRSTAAAVFFHEILGHRLEGHRQRLESEGQTFTKQLGELVTAPFLSIYDDPTLERLGGMPLSGHYRFDDEGVPARRVDLVKDGRLTGFLMSRMPIAAAARSNGHGRRSSGSRAVARMGNLVVEATGTVPAGDLRRLLVLELKRQGKPWGLWFEDVTSGNTTTSRDGAQAFQVVPKLVYRVYADGRPDEPVRGVDIVGTPLAAFTKIAAAGDDLGVFNGICGAESGWVPVSASAPSLLLTEIEVQKSSKDAEKPPLLPPPHNDAEKAAR